MSPTEAPDFRLLLAQFIEKIPETSRPAFLAELERGAAERYRGWAKASPDNAAGLLACADREDEIAQRVDKLFPADAEGRASIESTVPEARIAYYEVLDCLSITEQWHVQASAERQGADAWRLLASQQSDEVVKQELLACADLEELSAAHLTRLLDAS